MMQILIYQEYAELKVMSPTSISNQFSIVNKNANFGSFEKTLTIKRMNVYLPVISCAGCNVF